MTSKHILTQPCYDCPFRKDQAFGLCPTRALEITAFLEHDGYFICHNTTHRPKDEQSTCGGALHWLDVTGRLDRNSFFRIMGRIGLLPYPLPRLKEKAEVSPSRWHLSALKGESKEETATRCREMLEELLGEEIAPDNELDSMELWNAVREHQVSFLDREVFWDEANEEDE